MANSAEGRAFTELYRRLQVLLRGQVSAAARLTRPLLSVENLDMGREEWLDSLEAVARVGYSLQVKHSSDYLQQFTAAEIGREPSIVKPRFDVEELRKDFEIRGPIYTKIMIGKGVTPVVALEKSHRLVEAGVGRAVLDFGREMVGRSAAKTLEELGRGKKGGWRRVADAKPCAFCAMLAGRGAVYSKETVGFETHDDCGCSVEPVFTRWEPTPLENQWRQAYLDAGLIADKVEKARMVPPNKSKRLLPKKDRDTMRDTILWRMRRLHPELFNDGVYPKGTIV